MADRAAEAGGLMDRPGTMEDPTEMVVRLRQVRSELEMYRPTIEHGLRTIAPHVGEEEIGFVGRTIAEIDAISLDLSRHLDNRLDEPEHPPTPDEAEAILAHMARSLEMSAHPEPDRIDEAIIEKMKAVLGPERYAALRLRP